MTRLMELLLEYRSIRQEESRDNQMSCIVNLLEFYNEHRREEMFIRHLKKLYDLHMECENWAEAGFTLEKQTKVRSEKHIFHVYTKILRVFIFSHKKNIQYFHFSHRIKRPVSVVYYYKLKELKSPERSTIQEILDILK